MHNIESFINNSNVDVIKFPSDHDLELEMMFKFGYASEGEDHLYAAITEDFAQL
jgi:hypothetical protein